MYEPICLGGATGLGGLWSCVPLASVVSGAACRQPRWTLGLRATRLGGLWTRRRCSLESACPPRCYVGISYSLYIYVYEQMTNDER